MRTRHIDITGQQFGRLTVVRRNGTQSYGNSHNALWECRCECGTVKTIRSCDLRSGVIRSCGCLKNETASRTMTTHGKSRSPEYIAWVAMRQRCTNPKNPGFKDYGGRGITVCDRWQDFANFLADVGPRPSAEHSIDRIDNDGNYKPGNVRWTTRHVQSRNRTRTRLFTFAGKTLCLKDWSRELGIPYGTLRKRLKLGWGVERLLSTPQHSNVS